jgi:hypothetical protein
MPSGFFDGKKFKYEQQFIVKNKHYLLVSGIKILLLHPPFFCDLISLNLSNFYDPITLQSKQDRCQEIKVLIQF